MKLLDKPSISNLKALERKREIDEGAKLAKKIDTLRELSASEQTNLSRFRDETLKKVREEIDSAMGERDALAREVVSLKEERDNLKSLLTHTEESITNLTTST